MGYKSLFELSIQTAVKLCHMVKLENMVRKVENVDYRYYTPFTAMFTRAFISVFCLCFKKSA